MKKSLFVLGIAMALLFSGCASSGKSNIRSAKADLDKFAGDWQIIYAEKGGIAQSITNATIHIENQKNSKLDFTGFLGVNDFNGSCVAEADGSITDKNFGLTKKMGPRPAMEAENIIFEVFANMTEAKVGSEDGFAVVTFTSEETNSSVKFRKIALAGTKWNLSLIKDDEVLSSSYIEFVDEKNASANTGVNSLQMGYAYDAKKGTLTFEPGPMTLMAGDETSTAVELAFLSAVGESEKYQIKGDKLLVCNKAGDALLTFTKEILK